MKKIFTSFHDFNDTIPILKGGRFFLDSSDVAKTLQIKNAEEIIHIKKIKNIPLKTHTKELINLLSVSLERNYEGSDGLKFWIGDIREFLTLMQYLYIDLGKMVRKRESSRYIVAEIVTRTIVDILGRTEKLIETKTKNIEYGQLKENDIENIKLQMSGFLSNAFLDIMKLCITWRNIKDEEIVDTAATILHKFKVSIVQNA